MRVLVDLNVLLDVVQRREPHYAASAEVLSRIAHGDIQGAVAGHSITTIYYVVSKFAERQAADEAVDWILRDMEVIAEGSELFLRARALEMGDFEDAVVASAAESQHCQWIVTRNVDDFDKSPVPAVTPLELSTSLDLEQ